MKQFHLIKLTCLTNCWPTDLFTSQFTVEAVNCVCCHPHSHPHRSVASIHIFHCPIYKYIPASTKSHSTFTYQYWQVKRHTAFGKSIHIACYTNVATATATVYMCPVHNNFPMSKPGIIITETNIICWSSILKFCSSALIDNTLWIFKLTRVSVKWQWSRKTRCSLSLYRTPTKSRGHTSTRRTSSHR